MHSQNSFNRFAIQLFATVFLTGVAGAMLFAATDFATRGVIA